MKKLIYALATLLAAMSIAPQAYAIPGYARQTGMECTACHFQSFPALNAFGRSFKAGGYTMIGSQLKIEGSEGFSLPVTLNAGVVTKIRYQKSNGPATTAAAPTNSNDGQLQFPDEMLLMVGGRVSENIGAQLEMDLTGGNPVVANFKMPFIYDVGAVKAGVIPFTTAGQGVAYGFELMNTGAVRGQRIMEARKSFSAQQYINTGSDAQGIAVVASNSMYFANFSKWSPRKIGDPSGSPSANYLRVAFTPSLGGWDTGVGLQSWSGNTTDITAAYVVTKAYSIDAQAQGEVAAMPLGVYLTHASANATTAGEANLFNSQAKARTATTIAGQLGVLPGRATVLMAYRKGDNGKATGNGDNSLMIGATYQVVQNVQLQLNHEMFSGSAYDGAPADGDRLTTFMLFAAF